MQSFFRKSFRKYFCRNIIIYVKSIFIYYIYHNTIIVFTHLLIRVFFIICSLMSVNVIQHRWAVGNFDSHLYKANSLLGISPLLEKVVYAGCEITLGHRTCPANLAQRPIEKQFLLLNVGTMSVENLFFVKP